MEDQDNKPKTIGRAVLRAGLVCGAIIAFYVLSYGPALSLSRRGIIPADAFAGFYRPLPLSFQQEYLNIWVRVDSKCNRIGPPAFLPDYGARVHQYGRRASGKADVLPLGDTGFRAVVCVSHYTDTEDTDPDFYLITVQREYQGSSWVHFERQFPASNVPPSALAAKAADVVLYDAARRLVSFKIGGSDYSYKLPRNLSNAKAQATKEMGRAAGSEDIRSKITEAGEEKQITGRIDPDKSVYGIPFGTTEDEFTRKHGKPIGYVRLSGDSTAMIFGKSHAFVFEGAKLAGLRISHSILDWKLADMSASGPFDRINWQLSNGIENGMSLVEVKKILGDKLSQKLFSYSYRTEKARVELDFSHYTSEGDGDEAHKVHGILVRQSAAKADDTLPGIAEEFGGVGILLGYDPEAELPNVKMVMRGSPAEKADIRSGMLIVSVDGTALHGKTLRDSVKLLRGKPDSQVTVEVVDSHTAKTNKVTLRRIRISAEDEPTK